MSKTFLACLITVIMQNETSVLVVRWLLEFFINKSTVLQEWVGMEWKFCGDGRETGRAGMEITSAEMGVISVHVQVSVYDKKL